MKCLFQEQPYAELGERSDSEVCGYPVQLSPSSPTAVHTVGVVSVIGDDILASELYGSALLVDQDTSHSASRRQEFNFAGAGLDLVRFSAMGANGVQCAASPVRVVLTHRSSSIQSQPLNSACLPVLLASRCVVLAIQEASFSPSASNLHGLLHSLCEIVPAALAAEGAEEQLEAGSTVQVPPFGHLHLMLPRAFAQARPAEEVLAEVLRMETGRPLQKDQQMRNAVRRVLQVAFTSVQCAVMDSAGVAGRQYQVAALRRALVPQLRHMSALAACADSRLLVPLSRFVQHSTQGCMYENGLPAFLNGEWNRLLLVYEAESRDRASQALNGVLDIQENVDASLALPATHSAQMGLLPNMTAEIQNRLRLGYCVVLTGMEEARKSHQRGYSSTARSTLQSAAKQMQALADRYSPGFAEDLQAHLARDTLHLLQKDNAIFQEAQMKTYKSALELSCDLATKQCDQMCGYFLEHANISSAHLAHAWQASLNTELAAQLDNVQKSVLRTLEGRGLPAELLDMRRQAIINHVHEAFAQLGELLRKKLSVQAAGAATPHEPVPLAVTAAEKAKAVEQAVQELQKLVPQLIRQLASTPVIGKTYNSGFSLQALATRLNEYFDEYAAALAGKYGESAAEQFRSKCVDFNLDVHNQYNQAAGAALSAAQHSSEIRQHVLGVLPVWGLPPFCHPDAAQRALVTFEQQLGEAHASASASAVQELTARCQGWAEWADFRERFDHVLGQMQRGVTVEVESRRAAASAAVRTVIQEAEMVHLQQERQQEWQVQRNPPVRDVRRKNTLANEAKEFDAPVQGKLKIESQSQWPQASQPKTAAGAQVKAESVTVGKKRKPDLAPGEFVGGAVSTVKEESVLERSKREAQAALQARLDSFSAGKGRDKAKPRVSSSSSSPVSSSSNGTWGSSSRRVTREEEEAAAVAPHNEDMEQEEEEEEEVVSVKQEIKKRPSSSPGKRAKPSPAPKPKPAAVKAARTPVKAKPTPAKRKQPVSLGDTLAGAKLAAAAELARRAEAYVPTVRGGNRANAGTEDKQELQPDKKRARK